MKYRIFFTASLLMPLFSLHAEDTLGELSGEQMKAVSHLVKALRDIKVIITDKPVQDDKVKNPFDEKKEFVMPPRPRGENMSEKLEDAAKRNSEAGEMIRCAERTANPNSGESNGETAKKALESVVEKLKKDLEKMAQGKSLDAADRKAIENLLRNEEKTGAEIKENNFDEASLSQQKQEVEIKKTLEKIKMKSDLRTRAAFEAARGKADEIAHAGGEIADPEKREAVERLISELAEKLKNDSMTEYEKGSYDNSERLAQAAREVWSEKNPSGKEAWKSSTSPLRRERSEDSKKGSADQGPQSLKNALAEIQYAQKKPSEIASDALERAEIMADELKFSAKTGYDDITLSDIKKLADELSRTVEDIDYAMSNMQSGKENGKVPPEAAGGSENGAGTDTGLGRSEVNALLDSLYKAGRGENLPSQTELMSIHEALESVMRKTEKRLKEKRAMELIENYSPDEIPPKYRQNVSEYFRRLSDNEKITDKKK